MPALGIKNTSFTLPASSIIPSGMVGGTPQNPVTPVVTTSIASIPATGNCFLCDLTETYYYFFDGYGSVWQTTVASGVSVQILNIQTLYGNSIRVATSQLSADGTKLYLLLNNNTMVQILTAAPYTLSLVAGAVGANTMTDGVGTAARINTPATMSFLSNDGTILYFIDYNGSANVLRQIVLATFTFTSLNVINLALWNSASNLKLTKSGTTVYGGNYGNLNRISIFGNSSVPCPPQNPSVTTGSWEWTPDTRAPMERCIYGVNNVNGGVWRYDLNILSPASPWTLLTTLAQTPSTGARQCMLWRNNHLLIMAGTSLYKAA